MLWSSLMGYPEQAILPANPCMLATLRTADLLFVPFPPVRERR